MNEFYSLKAKKADGKTFDFSELKGKTVLIVNVASECGLTPQYDGLEDLYKQYSAKDFVILGFPSNEFGAQEPGTNEEIQNFCRMNFGVTFPVMAKTMVNGDSADPIYKFLKAHAPGPDGNAPIKWNFGAPSCVPAARQRTGCGSSCRSCAGWGTAPWRNATASPPAPIFT